ncbi:unnamed protein product [Bacillus thuringiensis DB27]|uniref:Uncharacterized protein n=1 Tax=Bacillus thuringiensis DB27 TaxID=1431339 RepID=W8YLG2_BACTU|nr:unnamed protein product [Bacillus thuringiensis DB27]
MEVTTGNIMDRECAIQMRLLTGVAILLKIFWTGS